jgi:8-oxo-dGTP diphosphatase
MRLYVVRHAKAVSRASWGDGDERPLTGRGRQQAVRIADRLADAGVTQLVSSPSLRCVQTLEPLAERLDLPIECDGRLQEGAQGPEALALADELRAQRLPAAVCSHGDVIPELLRLLRAGATRFTDPLVWPKGSIWVVAGDGAGWSTARYVGPGGRE